MSGCIAVINAGSSSVKFALCADSDNADILFRGQIEGIGVSPRLHVKDAQGGTVVERAWPATGFDHDAATREILNTGVRLASGTPVRGIGHRVVHGGMKFDAPVRLDRDVLEALARLEPLAPLHQPHNLAPIRTIFDAAPHVTQVACFDTAFHRSQSRVAQAFALPRQFTDAGVRRYGFHGLSYEYLLSRLRELRPELASGRVILAHLGNGASLCATHQGRSVASTMGFHRRRWADDGYALRRSRPRRDSLPDARTSDGHGSNRGPDLSEIRTARRVRTFFGYADAEGIVRSDGT